MLVGRKRLARMNRYIRHLPPSLQCHSVFLSPMNACGETWSPDFGPPHTRHFPRNLEMVDAHRESSCLTPFPHVFAIVCVADATPLSDSPEVLEGASHF